MYAQVRVRETRIRIRFRFQRSPLVGLSAWLRTGLASALLLPPPCWLRVSYRSTMSRTRMRIRGRSNVTASAVMTTPDDRRPDPSVVAAAAAAGHADAVPHVVPVGEDVVVVVIVVVAVVVVRVAAMVIVVVVHEAFVLDGAGRGSDDRNGRDDDDVFSSGRIVVLLLLLLLPPTPSEQPAISRRCRPQRRRGSRRRVRVRARRVDQLRDVRLPQRLGRRDVLLAALLARDGRHGRLVPVLAPRNGVSLAERPPLRVAIVSGVGVIVVVVVVVVGVDHAEALLRHREHDLHQPLLDGPFDIPLVLFSRTAQLAAQRAARGTARQQGRAAAGLLPLVVPPVVGGCSSDGLRGDPSRDVLAGEALLPEKTRRREPSQVRRDGALDLDGDPGSRGRANSSSSASASQPVGLPGVAARAPPPPPLLPMRRPGASACSAPKPDRALLDELLPGLECSPAPAPRTPAPRPRKKPAAERRPEADRRRLSAALRADSDRLEPVRESSSRRPSVSVERASAASTSDTQSWTSGSVRRTGLSGLGVAAARPVAGGNRTTGGAVAVTGVAKGSECASEGRRRAVVHVLGVVMVLKVVMVMLMGIASVIVVLVLVVFQDRVDDARRRRKRAAEALRVRERRLVAVAHAPGRHRLPGDGPRPGSGVQRCPAGPTPEALVPERPPSAAAAATVVVAAPVPLVAPAEEEVVALNHVRVVEEVARVVGHGAHRLVVPGLPPALPHAPEQEAEDDAEEEREPEAQSEAEPEALRPGRAARPGGIPLPPALGFVYDEVHAMDVRLRKRSEDPASWRLCFVLPVEADVSHPPYTIMTLPGSIAAPWPYMPPSGCCFGMRHRQELYAWLISRTASCGSAGVATSPTHPPSTTTEPPSSLSTAVWPDRLYTLGEAAASSRFLMPPSSLPVLPSWFSTWRSLSLSLTLFLLLFFASSLPGISCTSGGCTLTYDHVSSGRLQTAAVLMLIKAHCVWPPRKTKLACCVTEPDMLVMDGGSCVTEKPAKGERGPATDATPRV
ncbi:LOW QUALITY PROTEIN: hypothetical protein O9K51_03300 [Purpureocillium lavendulum]|uniref:Uncharacterized protein n=1 Tax=Purpureocillium lavendulum TaxID=1247861 RepID=A0AB34G0I6_9HYPO|nr:LOW QUALITY PROTEIN: hypothetical protein O9K51_03300 [Purpureocillium lavendulum]